MSLKKIPALVLMAFGLYFAIRNRAFAEACIDRGARWGNDLEDKRTLLRWVAVALGTSFLLVGGLALLAVVTLR